MIWLKIYFDVTDIVFPRETQPPLAARKRQLNYGVWLVEDKQLRLRFCLVRVGEVGCVRNNTGHSIRSA